MNIGKNYIRIKCVKALAVFVRKTVDKNNHVDNIEVANKLM